jgi:hypothetical protein
MRELTGNEQNERFLQAMSGAWRSSADSGVCADILHASPALRPDVGCDLADIRDWKARRHPGGSRDNLSLLSL